MKITAMAIPEVILVQPSFNADERGLFLETYQAERYRQAGIAATFVQDNVSRSCRGVIRGLHFQHPRGQGKLVYVLAGEILDVAVDIRRGSPTFGRFVSAWLSSENHHQLWIPAGFAHGFFAASEPALVTYKCSDYYSPADEHTVRWDDPEIGVPWPSNAVQLSPKDRCARPLRDLTPEELPSGVPVPGSVRSA